MPVFLGNNVVDGVGFVHDQISVGVDAEGKVAPELGSQVQGIGGSSFVHGDFLGYLRGRFGFGVGLVVGEDGLENITGWIMTTFWLVAKEGTKHGR